ncbi:MAG: DNA polymerase III subunit gamma/tau [Leptonema sp. (in: bacteria)]
MMNPYKVLSRRYRPQKFEEVLEQSHTIYALENAIKENRLGSAYLFFGPRGIGKTTIARILAKRVNCFQPLGVEPCNECESCKEITAGTSMDVIEIDAASNRRIEDIRDLRENVKFKPILGKKKIYIIDEVHMLTRESFNALLKTLEEPPEHILFILATTEINKIPETILSRCQIFIFKKVNLNKLQNYLEQIAIKEKIKIDKNSLFLIAKKGDGSVRDSLSFFEQVIAYCNGEITSEKIKELMGNFPIDLFINLTYNLFTDISIEQLIAPITEIFENGGDLEKFIWEYLEFLRICILAKKGVYNKEILGLIPEDIEKIKNLIEAISLEKILAIFEEFYQLKSKAYLLKLKNSYEARVLLEITLIKIHEKLKKPTLEEIIRDINVLTKYFEGIDISEEKLFYTSEENSQPKDREIKKSEKPKEEPNIPKLEDEIQNKFLGSYITDENQIPKLPV